MCLGKLMQIIDDVRQTRERFPNTVLTIGSFDGVHLGHQRILTRLAEDARARQGTAALMTLCPHPREYFAPDHAPNLLTSQEKKAELLAAHGVEVLYVLPFGAEVAGMDREAFLHDIVLARCGARKLVVGHDFAFGKGAAGNFDYLQEVAPGLGLEVEQAQVLILDGERVSSTRIRELVLQGDLDQARRLLGRSYAITGVVQAGRGMGAKLGFPTANVTPGPHVIPMHGVYAGEAVLDGHRHQAAVNVGIAPTIRHDDIMIEAHLLDFDENLVGRRLEVVFHQRLRPELKYPSHAALIEGIARDVKTVREYFQARG